MDTVSAKSSTEEKHTNNEEAMINTHPNEKQEDEEKIEEEKALVDDDDDDSEVMLEFFNPSIPPVTIEQVRARQTTTLCDLVGQFERNLAVLRRLITFEELIDFWSQNDRPYHIIKNGNKSDEQPLVQGVSVVKAHDYLTFHRYLLSCNFVLQGAFIAQCVELGVAKEGGLGGFDIIRNDPERFQNTDFEGKFRLYAEAKRVVLNTMSSVSSGSVNADSLMRWVAEQIPYTNGKRVTIMSPEENVSHCKCKDCLRLEDYMNGKPLMFVVRDVESNKTAVFTAQRFHTIKFLLTEFAKWRGVKLDSFRYLVNGRPLFWGEVRDKTPVQMGVVDSVRVECIRKTDKEMEEDLIKKEQQAKNKTKNKKSKVAATGRASKKKKQQERRSRRLAHAEESKAHSFSDNDNLDQARFTTTRDAEQINEYRFMHSRLMSRVLDEANPKFAKIRRKLNDLSLQRSAPKIRSPRLNSHKNMATTTTVNDCSNIFQSDSEIGLGGKAGKIYYVCKIGEVANLYKTSKPFSHRGTTLSSSYSSSSSSSSSLSDKSSQHQIFDALIDLHGLTRVEARSKLDESLPHWIRKAMEGSYPFVITVKIVCGGGGQVLSEEVEDWIGSHDAVGKAF